MGKVLDSYEMEINIPVETMDAIRSQWKECRENGAPDMRVDGRTGLLSYAKGAGYLEMCALWGWPITHVMPSVWCKKVKAGIDRKLSTKDQSILAVQSLWPQLLDKDSEINIFASDRARKPCDGMAESLLIAYWYYLEYCASA